jgi:acyl carrier protein
MTANREDAATEIERTLGEIWCRVLSLAQVERTDEFFGLGGDSLKAMRMLATVSEAFSVEVPVEALVSSPTLADLAVCVTGLVAEAELNRASAREYGEL